MSRRSISLQHKKVAIFLMDQLNSHLPFTRLIYPASYVQQRCRQVQLHLWTTCLVEPKNSCPLTIVFDASLNCRSLGQRMRAQKHTILFIALKMVYLFFFHLSPRVLELKKSWENRWKLGNILQEILTTAAWAVLLLKQ